jgi:hypothetical protein
MRELPGPIRAQVRDNKCPPFDPYLNRCLTPPFEIQQSPFANSNVKCSDSPGGGQSSPPPTVLYLQSPDDGVGVKGPKVARPDSRPYSRLLHRLHPSLPPPAHTKSTPITKGGNGPPPPITKEVRVNSIQVLELGEDDFSFLGGMVNA